MVQTNGMLGRAGWELKACYADPSKILIDNTKTYNYYIVHELLCHKALSDKNGYYHHALAFSLESNRYDQIRWEIDNVAYNLIGYNNPEGFYEAYDLEKIKTTIFNIITRETPSFYRETPKELACLIWLNNLHYHPVFMKILKSDSQSIIRFVKIMIQLRYSHKNGEGFAVEAYEVYNLPDMYVDALF